MIEPMFAVRFALAASLLGACSDVSQTGTVFACDPEHPCPGTEVCSGTEGVCLDHAVLLYDSFEGALDAVRWRTNEVAGDVTVDTTLAHWGESALQCTSEGAATASVTHTFDAPLPDHVFVRVFVQQPDSAPYVPYLRLAAGDGSSAITMHGETAQLSYKMTVDASTQSVEGGRVVAAAWTCVELELAGLPASGEAAVDARIYLDGNEQPELRLSAPLRALTELELGGYSATAVATRFDDVIVDTQRVGCDR